MQFCHVDGTLIIFVIRYVTKIRENSSRYHNGWKHCKTISVAFDLSPLNYHEIASIIRKMRTSASPCPFDQVSVIVLKKCPFLRTILWRILKRSWETKSIISQWKASLTVFATDQFITRPIEVQRSVLQGDSLSPLLFNMCFNTLMKTVDQAKIKCSGYIFGKTLHPQNWLQFADDTTIVKFGVG